MEQNLKDSIERWLMHGSYRFKMTDGQDMQFCFTIRHLGGFGNPVQIFEPSAQRGIIVVGSKVALKNMQNLRYLKLNEQERGMFQQRIAKFCQSIKAVHRFHTEDGKMLIGVYVILDKKEHLNGDHFLATVSESAEMGDKLAQFLAKTV